MFAISFQTQQILFMTIPIGIVCVLGLWTFGQAYLAQKFTKKYLQENKIEALVIRREVMPPMRLWLDNEKWDLWCKIRLNEDGVEKWVRVRGSLMSEPSFDFFD